MKILHIDSSADSKNSLSRALSKKMVDALKAKYPDAEVVYRDVSASPLPFVDDSWIENGGHAVTNEITDEFLSSDIFVFGVPVYNLSVPASFKAYIDQLVVAGKTFHYTPEGPKGLVPAGKKMFILSASGTPYEVLTQYGMNFHDGYLKAMFGFIGQTDVTILPYTGRSKAEESKITADADIEKLVASL